MILADETADAGWVAADLLAQAEHGSGDETVVLVTTSAALADGGGAPGRHRACASVANRARPRARPARHGAIVIVAVWPKASRRVNALAARARRGDDAATRRGSPRAVVAGAVFVGPVRAGGGGRLRHRAQPRAAHRRRRALRLAALRRATSSGATAACS